MDGWLSLEGAIYRAPTVLITPKFQKIPTFDATEVGVNNSGLNDAVHEDAVADVNDDGDDGNDNDRSSHFCQMAVSG